MRYRVALVGYVVSLSDGTDLVRGEYEVKAMYHAEARERARQMARAEIDGSLVVLDVVAVHERERDADR